MKTHLATQLGTARCGRDARKSLTVHALLLNHGLPMQSVCKRCYALEQKTPLLPSATTPERTLYFCQEANGEYRAAYICANAERVQVGVRRLVEMVPAIEGAIEAAGLGGPFRYFQVPPERL